MRRLIFALLAAPIALAMTTTASAAPYWSGAYIGAEGGYGWGSTRHVNEANGANSGTSDDLTGWIAGGTYGYNWRAEPFVFGFEGDFSWSGIRDSFNTNGLFCAGACITELKWLGTDRVRIGHAVGDRYLVFASGGLAFGQVEATCCVGLGLLTDETKWRAGWTVGGGVEAMLTPRLSAKVEYLYVDLGDHTNYHGVLNGVGESVRVRDSIVRVGINYHFDIAD